MCRSVDPECSEHQMLIYARRIFYNACRRAYVQMSKMIEDRCNVEGGRIRVKEKNKKWFSPNRNGNPRE